MTAEGQSREEIRNAFRPAHLKLLFIGESPPASGRFFYHRDSGLYRAMREAFRIADPSTSDEDFLAVFRSTGCYLVDLCQEPVDRLDSRSRRAACRAGEAGLSNAIARLQPAAMATLLRSIEDNAASAASAAQWRGPILHLPYPGRWSRHRKVFTDSLVPTIASLLRERPAHLASFHKASLSP